MTSSLSIFRCHLRQLLQMTFACPTKISWSTSAAAVLSCVLLLINSSSNFRTPHWPAQWRVGSYESDELLLSRRASKAARQCERCGCGLRVVRWRSLCSSGVRTRQFSTEVPAQTSLSWALAQGYVGSLQGRLCPSSAFEVTSVRAHHSAFRCLAAKSSALLVGCSGRADRPEHCFAASQHAERGSELC